MKKARMKYHMHVRTLAVWMFVLVISVMAFGMFASGGPASPALPIAGAAGAGACSLFFVGMAESLGMTEETMTPDKLLAGSMQPVTESVTLLTGENRTRGTLLGKITIGALSETHAGNTGNGVMTIDAVTPALAFCQAGVYIVKCILAAANGGTFRVFDPKGNALGDVAVAATFANQIKFVIADGATDFIVGDTFLVTVAAGSGKWKLSAAAAVDGSQVPRGILVRDTNATAADIVTGVYRTGEFYDGAITFGAGHTADSVREDLRDLGIHLKPGVAA